MISIFIALLAYTIDKFFGEFRFVKHPIIIIGDIITLYENIFYKDSIVRGFFLVVFVLGIVGFVTISIENYLTQLCSIFYIVISSILSSMFLAHKMLYDSVKDVLIAKDKRQAISMLVSRDTTQLSNSDINKASIETYGENLSDGVIAPLFYLLMFSFPGIVIYKAINTMDSMVGYKNKRYEKFGKVAAKLDDIANYIPSRLTAILLMLIGGRKDVFAFYKHGKKHESPNAGHPIAAMALLLDVKLGGNTSYSGEIKKKPFFGIGKRDIVDEDVLRALSYKKKIDFTLMLGLSLLGVLLYGC